MAGHARIALADWLQAAEIETHILVQEEDSVRADWWRASCGLHDWYTTGSKPNVEDAAAHHVAWDHTACAAVDPDSPADAPLYCRMLPGHGDDHFNGGRTWANDRKPIASARRIGRTGSIRIPDVCCPKCGNDNVAIRHCFGGEGSFTKDDRCRLGEPQHFHRHCGRCSYRWRTNETPLDAADA